MTISKTVIQSNKYTIFEETMKNNKEGVYQDTKKDGSLNYRASLTKDNKHISLGSYGSLKDANAAYNYGKKLLSSNISVNDYPKDCPLSFEKFVVLCNLRDNNIYISNPIYLEKRYFSYHYSPTEVYKFDMDDLFYLSSHKLMKRGNHLFVADYGSQVSLLERLNIRSHAVEGRDYRLINSDPFDLRRENIEIVNRYFGVTREEKKLDAIYKASINIKGKFIIGRYSDEIEAAIAYNKAVDELKKKGCTKKYPQNFIEGISAREYASIYSNVEISSKITELNDLS